MFTVVRIEINFCMSSSSLSLSRDELNISESEDCTLS